ncbi:MAG: hypothetical protein ACTH4U_06705 [Pseudoalteromonas prydzensis]|uniref:hypothetical protein n=1 Tax=Pseudoalteromonas prydzensis TaxID=182141 RepID=UPI003F9CD66A
MNKILILIALTILQLGCSGVANNRIAYGWVQPSQYDSLCLKNTLTKVSDLNELNKTASGFSFVVNNYKGHLVYKEMKVVGPGYELDLDGMFLGESYGTFTQNAEKIKNEIKGSIEKECGVKTNV